MKTGLCALVELLAVAACLSCSSVGPGVVVAGGEQPQGLLRLASVSPGTNRIHVWVVGSLMHSLQTKDFAILSIEAKGDDNRVLRTRLDVHGGDESKYGPYVAIIIDAGEPRGAVHLAATIQYKRTTYELSATYRAPRDKERYEWIAVTEEIGPKQSHGAHS